MLGKKEERAKRGIDSKPKSSQEAVLPLAQPLAGCNSFSVVQLVTRVASLHTSHSGLCLRGYKLTSKSGRGPPSFSQTFPLPRTLQEEKDRSDDRGQVTRVLAPARGYCLRARERRDFALPCLAFPSLPREVSPAAGPHSPAWRSLSTERVAIASTQDVAHAGEPREGKPRSGAPVSRSRCSPASLRGRRAAGKGSARQECSAGRAELPLRSSFQAGRPFQSEPDSRQPGFHARRIATSRRARGSAVRKNASPRARGCQRLPPRRNPPPSPNHLNFLTRVDLKCLIPAA